MGRFDRLREEKKRLEAFKQRNVAANKAPVPVKVQPARSSGISEKSAELIAEALRLMMKEQGK